MVFYTVLRKNHRDRTKAVLNYVFYAQNNVTFAKVLSLSSFVHKLARVAVIATCNSVNMCHFELSGHPHLSYTMQKNFWSCMLLGVE